MRALFALLIAASPVAAQDGGVSRDEGMAAWERIFVTSSHPRCTNCHVGPQEVPMWNGLGYGADIPHGMGVQADESRIGAESTPCRTCHITSSAPNITPHAPPRIEDAWRLPPVELAWLGTDSAGLCRQLRDPERNDGNDIADMIEHLRSSPFVAWGFAPGGGRDPAPGSVAQLARDFEIWGAAGTPCE